MFYCCVNFFNDFLVYFIPIHRGFGGGFMFIPFLSTKKIDSFRLYMYTLKKASYLHSNYLLASMHCAVLT